MAEWPIAFFSLQTKHRASTPKGTPEILAGIEA